jgi:hypothetical protein
MEADPTDFGIFNLLHVASQRRLIDFDHLLKNIRGCHAG